MMQKQVAFRPIPNMVSAVNRQSVYENLDAAWKLFCRVCPDKAFLNQVEDLLDELSGVIEY